MMRQGLEASPISQVLMEECLLGWKEYEMEVMRDYKDQCVVICSIEILIPWAFTPVTQSLLPLR